MSQIQYDITEFVIKNKDEIKNYLDNETSHVLFLEASFKEAPEMFEEIYQTHKARLLRYYLSNYFPDDYEQISLIIDKNFVKIYLQ